MAFSLCLKYLEERYYIHKNYGRSEQSPKTTHNQNYAMLFKTESDSVKFREKNAIPVDYEPTFLMLKLKDSDKKQKSPGQRKTVAIIKEDISKIMPDFLNGV